jgi:thiol-disulfide isomerase/thioredoxin
MFKRSELRKKTSANVFFLTLIVCLSTFATARAGTGEEIAWQTDYHVALELAKRTGKPLLIEFWAIWCGPCKVLDREVWPDPKVVALSRKFVCVAVDVDKDRATTGLYQATAIPAIILADPWGNVLNRHRGILHASALARMMEVIPDNFSEISEWNAALAEDGQHGLALLRIGEFYRRLKIMDLSNDYLKRALKSKAAAEDLELRESALVMLGLNYLRLKKYDDGRKTFEQCLKEVPQGSQGDIALLGLSAAELFQGKIPEAEKTIEQLRVKYPSSEALKKAEENLQQAKKQKK